MADQHGNEVAQEGCDRCECGCKYWENDKCIDCGRHLCPNCKSTERIHYYTPSHTNRLTVRCGECDWRYELTPVEQMRDEIKAVLRRRFLGSDMVPAATADILEVVARYEATTAIERVKR